MRIEEAIEVLDQNRRENRYTIPSEDLYPYQWNWDSGFIALGLANQSPEKAKKELESLIEAQWDNGMIPQIAFWQEAEGYYPGPEEWEIENNDVETSGITQPPVAVHALSELLNYIELTEAEELISGMERYLDWWRTERSYEGKVVYVRHPWETGMDDSPAWLPVMEEIEPGNPEYERKDLQLEGSEEERPEDWDYDRYIYLVRQGKQLDWDEDKLRAECPFQVADVLTNSIFVRACRELADIFEQKGNTEKAEEWREQAKQSSEKIRELMWDDEIQNFVSYDLVNNRQLEENTVAGLTVLYAQIPDQYQTEKLVENLDQNFLCFKYGCATYSGDRQDLDRYWRGPAWISTNWLLSEGLSDINYQDRANRIVEDSLELLEEHGFREYFNPETGKPRGARKFSWSASLYLYWNQ